MPISDLPHCIRCVRRDQSLVDRLIVTSGKMVLLDKLLRRLKDTGHRVLIFSQSVRTLDIISDYMRLRGLVHQRLDGSTPAVQRHQSMVGGRVLSAPSYYVTSHEPCMLDACMQRHGSMASPLICLLGQVHACPVCIALHIAQESDQAWCRGLLTMAVRSSQLPWLCHWANGKADSISQ